MNIEAKKVSIHRLQQELARGLNQMQKNTLAELIKTMLAFEEDVWHNIGTEAEYKTSEWLMRAYGIKEAIKAYSNLLPKD